MKSIRIVLLPGFAVTITFMVLWYSHLPAPLVETSLAQVEIEAQNGGYRLIDVATLSELHKSEPETVLLVDTRQEWEHRSGHIAESVNFPMEPTWWARWKKRGELKAFLGPEKGKTIVFY